MSNMDEDRFSRQIVETVAKRAGNICSNPDCQAITSGPAEDQSRSVNVGEAAHIFGARAGSARFNPAMSASERSDITNAIWLCRICHKLIDADVARFPSSLLFEWRRLHERTIIERLGRPGDLARQRLLARELEEFKDCSYLAQQIVIDKPPYWEFKLMAELLRSKLAPIVSRWQSLDRGLYSKPMQAVPLDDYLHWQGARIDEMQRFSHALGELINVEIPNAWGPPGVAGSDKDILRVCDLLAECCRGLLNWEEGVRFARVPRDFDRVRAHLVGVAGGLIEKVAIIPRELAKIFGEENPSGTHRITIDFDLPEGWADEFSRLFHDATNKAYEIDEGWVDKFRRLFRGPTLE